MRVSHATYIYTYGTLRDFFNHTRVYSLSPVEEMLVSAVMQMTIFLMGGIGRVDTHSTSLASFSSSLP